MTPAPTIALEAPSPVAPVSAPALTVSAPGPLEPIPAAEVIALDDLDFGEPSPFAAPPRAAVEPAPEQPELIDLPILEAEEEIELAPAAEFVPVPVPEEPKPVPEEPKEEPKGIGETGGEPWKAGHLPEARGVPAAAPLLLEQADTAPFVPVRSPAPSIQSVAGPDVQLAPSSVSLPSNSSAPPPRADLSSATPIAGAAPSNPPAVAAGDGGEAQLRDALSRASREVIERIAWEVVPQLAETIIREQIDRLVNQRQLNDRA